MSQADIACYAAKEEIAVERGRLTVFSEPQRINTPQRGNDAAGREQWHMIKNNRLLMLAETSRRRAGGHQLLAGLTQAMDQRGEVMEERAFQGRVSRLRTLHHARLTTDRYSAGVSAMRRAPSPAGD